MVVLRCVIAALSVVWWLQSCSVRAETPLKTRTVIDNIGIPWEVVWGPDNYLWITERQGRVSRVHPETGKATVLAILPDVKQRGESGLMGMALHPAFPAIPHVFLAYTYDDNGAVRVRIARYTYQPDTLLHPITLVEGIQGNVIHDGCRLLFAPDTTLLITTGDAADQSLPQQHDKLNGKILRINPDGTIPANNPWPSSMLYSTGHRNAQGLTWGPHGQLYSSEHGPTNDDEVNLIVPGYNYGWPRVHGYCDTPQEQEFCKDSTVVEPLIAWTPTLAVCGMEYYNHSAIPEWQNTLLLATLKASMLVQLQLSDDGTRITQERRYFVGTFGRLRDVCVAPDGRVFISTSNSDDNSIIEIKANVPDRGWIRPSQDTIDMGSLVEGETTAFARVILTNVGSTTATLASVALSGSSTPEFALQTLPLLPLSLAPYASTTLTVQFKPISAGRKQAVLRVTGDTDTPLEIVVRAEKKEAVSIETPVSVDIGIQAIHTKRNMEVVSLIANTGTTNLVVKRIVVAPPFFVTTPKNFPVTLPPKQLMPATVQFFPQQEGTFTRTLFVEFQGGIQREITIVGKTHSTTTVREEHIPIQLHITPNPIASYEVSIAILSALSGTAHIRIHDALGHVVADRQEAIHSGTNTVVWNTTNTFGMPCPAGMYFVTVTVDRTTTTYSMLLLR